MLLQLKDVSLRHGSKVLFEGANLSIFKGQKIGVIGHNGCGKSSLFALIQGLNQSDNGDIILQPGIQLSHLAQELPDGSQSALDYVLDGNDCYKTLNQRLIDAEKHEDHDEIVAVHNLMNEAESYQLPAKAATILNGLGFAPTEINQPVSYFSGGWRMRLNLARCLISDADFLLLDEPTNHLDLEAIFWLEVWLKSAPSSILVISHDRDFLDGFTTNIIHIHQNAMTMYTGNYSQFEQVYAERLALQQAGYEKQQTKIAHLQQFVNRFRAKASKAKQAQSRLKALDRMEVISKVQVDSPFSFEFYPCPEAGNPLLSTEKISAGYDPSHPILKNISFSLRPMDRIGFLGPNGQGKSTLIKTLMGELPPLFEEVSRHPKLNIGYFAQHQLEQLDLSQSPLSMLQKIQPKSSEQMIRNFLGGFNFMGDMATGSIQHFSGGEKARLVLAGIVFAKPNLLLLDEPTNHLDLDMRSALELALQNYEGALVVISHDRHFLKTTVDDFYLIFNKSVTPFDGDLDDYYSWLQKAAKKHPEAFITSQPEIKTEPIPHNKQKEQKVLQNRLKKLEQDLDKQQHEKQDLDMVLSDASLYEPENQEKLNKLLEKSKNLHEMIQKIEDEWMTIQTELMG